MKIGDKVRVIDINKDHYVRNSGLILNHIYEVIRVTPTLIAVSGGPIVCVYDKQFGQQTHISSINRNINDLERDYPRSKYNYGSWLILNSCVELIQSRKDLYRTDIKI